MTATPPLGQTEWVEDFETRQGAIDCAQLLDARGWKEIRCQHVTSQVKRFDFEPSEELVDVEWQCHVFGGNP
uniref:Uncharacterized protein n=1 Tax=Variovorax sp. HH01 TaxID=1084736 RepID=I3PCS7_9BURK|nr:hypothetical protein var107 [Variovorax sp. HH01]